MSENTSIAQQLRSIQDEEERRELLRLRNEMIEKNVALVASIAKKHLGQGVDFEDLFQEGIIGLSTAAEKFDPSRGFRFSTYATWWIRQAVEDALLKQSGVVKKPSNYMSHLKSLIQASQKLEIELGRNPSVLEISRKANMDPRMARQLLSLVSGAVSLDAPIGDGSNSGRHMDFLREEEPSDPYEKNLLRQMREDVDDALSKLNPKEAEVLRLRFGLCDGRPRSLREVGKGYNLSPERIRQIETRAMNKLRAIESAGNLKEYLCN